VAALDADALEAGALVRAQAGLVVGEDAACELVVTGSFGRPAERFEQLGPDAAATRGAVHVNGVLANALVDAAVGVGTHAREPDHLAVALGHEERPRAGQPRREVACLAWLCLEGGNAIGDALVVDRGDRVKVPATSGPYRGGLAQASLSHAESSSSASGIT
jgi:hypothetical protein